MPPLGNEHGVLRARFLFNSREQQSSESLEDFLKSLKELSKRCKYEASQNLVQDLLRDRLISGLRNKEIQARLLNCPDDLALDRALDVANSTEVAKKIKQEHDDFEELPSIHDKLHVQVDVSVQKPDIKVSEEAKIAILIELLNHKAVLMAPIGHECEKADLWERVFGFAKSVGAPFRTALHLREVFGTWKHVAIQSRQRSNQEDVKMSNSDKLIWDLFGHDDNLEEYPNFGTNANGGLIEDDSAELFAEVEEAEGAQENFSFDANDLASLSSSEEDNDHESDEDYVKPAKRSRGRPPRESTDSVPKNNSTSITTDLKILILKRLVLTKNVIAAQGNEKEKKDIWRNIHKSLEKKLANSSPSALRSAFRIWKNKAMKKRENQEETVTESDRLIYNIFDLQEIEQSSHDPIDALISEVKEEVVDELPEFIIEEKDPGRGYIDHSTKISVLQEVAKHREVIGMNMGSVYEKESAWREIHEKITAKYPNLNYLSVRTMKELMKMWQAKAFHAALKHGGPMTSVQKLMYHIYAIDRNAAAPFANLENGGPPPLSHKVPGCVHYTPEIKIAILRELLKHKKQHDALDKALVVAMHYKVSDVNKVRLKYAVKQWKHRAIKLHQDGQTPKNKADKLLFELYDLKVENALSQCEEEEEDLDGEQEAILELSEQAKMATVNLVESQPSVLCRRTKELFRKPFWSKALEKVKELEPEAKIDVNSLRKAFWTWKDRKGSSAENLAFTICESVLTAPTKSKNWSEEIKAAVLHELHNQQETLLLGTSEQVKNLFFNLVMIPQKHGINIESGFELELMYTTWKKSCGERLKRSQHHQLRACERIILEICLGQSNVNVSTLSSDGGLTNRAKEILLPLLKTHARVLNEGDLKEKQTALKEMLNQVQHLQLAMDYLGLYKVIHQWKCFALKKKLMELSLSETDIDLLDTFEFRVNDSIDADLLVYLTDSSCFDHQKLQVIIPEAAKYVVFNAVSTKHELVFGTNLREIANFWSETLDMIRAKDDAKLHCPSHQHLQRAFFVWMYEAWKKRLNNEYLTPQENTMLDLAHLKKALLTEHFDYDENNVNHLNDNVVEISEVSFESMIQDLLEIKDLLHHGDKALFWTLGMKLAQAFWINCDSPPRLFVTMMSWRIKAQQKILQHIPLHSYEKSIFEIFGIANDLFSHAENEDDGDDVFEEENLWDSLKNEITDQAKMTILNSLVAHKDILITRRRGRLDHDRNFLDRIAVWQKALNIAIDEGIKVESHTKLIKIVKEWREVAQKNRSEDATLEPWEDLVLSIFDAPKIKEEIEDEDDSSWMKTESSYGISGSVPEAIKVIIAKSIMRQKQLIFSENEADNETGWRKVFRIANGNGAFLDDLSTLKASAEQWKLRAIEKLTKDPSAIRDLDKLMISIYDLDLGGLDLEHIKEPIDKSNDLLVPIRLTTGGKITILEEVLRNKPYLIEGSGYIPSHRDRFYAWHNVFRIAHSVGGNFSCILQLSNYIKLQLRASTEEKIQSRSKINEVDTLMFKIFDDLDGSGLEFLSDHQVPVETQHGCRICQITFHRFDELRLHQQMHHGQALEQDFARKCRLCGNDVGEKPAMRAHLRTNHPQEPFVCDYCDQMFFNDLDFYQHVKEHVVYNPMESLEEVLEDSIEDDSKSNNIYGTMGAAQRQRKRGMYRKRVKVEITAPDEGEGELPRIGKKEGGLCPHCGEYYKHVQQHIMYKHETKKPWKCDQCDYAHALQKGLQEHVRNCHPKESDLKVCHICGYKTTINHNLKEHIERTHEKKRRFTCNLCDAHFYRKSVMERHVRVRHMGEKPCQCDICGIGFKNSNALRQHKDQVHFKTKITCPICGGIFVSKRNLKRHIESVHRGKKRKY